MAYIGVKPTIGNFQICDAISVVNGQAAYTMQVGSVNVIPQSANHMIVSLNGTIQKPNSSFTVSGSTITFASNLATGDVIDFIQILGDVLDLGVPSDATVTAAKLASTSITGQTAEATVANDDTVLIHDTSASALRKMTVSNLTANAGIDGWSSSSGNLLPADASKGIYLGVNSATAANLLDDYEEGSYTTTLTSGLGASVNSWNYTKIGNFVILSGKVTINSTDGSGTHIGMSLPFNSSGRNAVTVNFVSGQNVGDIGLVAYSNNNSSMYFYNVKDNANETNHTNDEVSNGDEYYMTFTYRSA